MIIDFYRRWDAKRGPNMERVLTIELKPGDDDRDIIVGFSVAELKKVFHVNAYDAMTGILHDKAPWFKFYRVVSFMDNSIAPHTTAFIELDLGNHPQSRS